MIERKRYMVKIELVFVAAEQTIIHEQFALENGATVADAIAASGILELYPETATLPVGIFSKPVTRDTLLSAGDRVELYRALIIDPKHARRQRGQNKLLRG